MFLHKARSGRIIVKLIKKVEVGKYLLDERGRKVGKVAEIIGPVSSPYASLVPLTDRAGKKGDKLYVG